MVRERSFIPETTKVRLIEAGIPAEKHTPEALAELFPKEFNIRAIELSADDLARVLIHFIQQRIVLPPNRKSRICVRKVGPGWHACHFYQDFEQLLEIIAPYIAEGLKNREACLWVLPGKVPMSMACAALRRHVETLDGCLADGQLELLPHQDWYLDMAGRLKSFEEIGAALLAKQESALTKGFTLLRAAGDAGWISCAEQSREFIDYENKVNAALHATKVAAVCTYRVDVTADELIAIVNAHQDSIYSSDALQ
jgi:hypothetical protein